MGRRPLGTRGCPAEFVMVGSGVQDRQIEDTWSNVELVPKNRQGDGELERVEVYGVIAKCSFSQMHDVIQRLDDRNKQLVRETGFYGLLYFPPFRQIDRRFVLWLLCRVDALANTLFVSEEVRIRFCKEDVGRIFSIPCGGKPVAENGRPKKATITKVMTDHLGMESCSNRSIKGLQDIIVREYERDMTEKECKAFKIAFVAYVMSTLLCPGSRFDHASVDYWDVFVDCDEIASYDWCGYVLERLLEAVVKIKIDLNAKRKSPNISGCNLFLQVLYLDSIDLGLWSMDHSCFPRIRCLGPKKMRAMIRADTVKYTVDMKARVFGKNKLRRRSTICYSWAGCEEDFPVPMNNDMWEASLSLVCELDAPDEAAVRLYNALAGIDAQSCLRIKSALCSIVELFAREVNGKSCGTQSVMHGVCGVDEDVGECSFGGNGLADGMKAEVSCGVKRRHNEIGEGGHVVLDGSSNGLVSFENSSNCKFAEVDRSLSSRYSLDLKDPWTLGFKFKVNHEEAQHLLGEVFGIANEDGDNLASYNNSGVKLLFGDGLLGKQLSGEVDIESRLFSRVLMSFKERDDALYSDYGFSRWRRFVKPDFMEGVLGGRFGKRSPASWLDVELDDAVNAQSIVCGMIFFPALVSGRWVCYAWMAEVNKFYVFDPHPPGGCGDEVQKFHENAFKLICDAVWDTLSKSCGRCDSSLSDASTSVLDVDDCFLRSNRSGVACLYFCGMFDGVAIRGMESLDIEHVTPVIFCEALDCLF